VEEPETVLVLGSVLELVLEVVVAEEEALVQVLVAV
jgi:hypothetical protein